LRFKSAIHPLKTDNRNQNKLDAFKVPNFGIPQWGSKRRMDKSSERVKLPLLVDVFE